VKDITLKGEGEEKRREDRGEEEGEKEGGNIPESFLRSSSSLAMRSLKLP